MDKKYQAILNVVNADIEKINSNLAFDIDLPAKIRTELNKFLQLPSKRIRSLMVILYMRATKMYLLPTHYELLAAVELMHNASLIHDDVIDNENERRNSKTLNKLFGNQLAVISGDFLLGIALEKLTRLNNSKINEIFAKTLQTMCKGEITQYLNKFKKIKLEKYIEKSTQKTSSLFESALHSSVILADEEYNEKMQEFAINFGLAFQIRDDLNNVLSDKSIDIESGIYNAPLILSDDIDKGIEKTKVLLNNYVNCAKLCLNEIPQSIYKTALLELLELIRDV